MRSTTGLCFALFALTGAPAAGQEFIPLGDLPGGQTESFAFGISADGNVVVGRSFSGNGPEAFRWENGVMTGLGDLPGDGFSSAGHAASADGSIIAGLGYSISLEATLWTDAGPQGLGYLNQVGVFSWAEDISDDGAVVVGRSSASGGTEGFVWTRQDGAMRGIGRLIGGDFTSANGVSPDGSLVVGINSNSFESRAVRWTLEEGLTLLDIAQGSNGSEAFAANNAGVIVGTSRPDTSSSEMAMWGLDGRMLILGDLEGGSTSSVARAISELGDRVVGHGVSTDTNPEAVLWTPDEGMRALKDILQDDFGLDLAGWELTFAHDISADGLHIVGYGTNPMGDSEGWLIRLPAACDADFNGDGDADSRDVLDFLSAWNVGEDDADIDGNNVLDTRDVLAFLNLWSAGC